MQASPSPCILHPSLIAQDQGAGRSGQVSPRTVPMTLLTILSLLLPSSQIRGCRPALSHLACRFKVAEGSLSTPVRAALGHGQAAHAHCNFAIILLLPSPPRRFLILLLPPFRPPAVCAISCCPLVPNHTPRRHSFLCPFSLGTISPMSHPSYRTSSVSSWIYRDHAIRHGLALLV